jgi:hypothetical protein
VVAFDTTTQTQVCFTFTAPISCFSSLSMFWAHETFSLWLTFFPVAGIALGNEVQSIFSEIVQLKDGLVEGGEQQTCISLWDLITEGAWIS